MDIEKLINILKNSNLKSVSRDTGIPNDRMYKWKQGKGKPKKEDFDMLVNYFENGISSESNNKKETMNQNDGIIDGLKEIIKSKNETIAALQSLNDELRERLSMHEGKPKTGTN